ncbi:acyloxyacyl hydrolase [Psittacicella gerlachiana]|uniref:Outer membrane protein beta-barrel domain-containing protein n=1 Tax=Psittacicella gerlachiana TaxID=2028574 RepID=A0A3A1YHV9_9GAMM|nr:acyloxyacyl hydrolase [Psittacicella gerlachiana]RIY35607.1 hypothetical protein CKF59_03420 [Psittacicella gerlachiana]
MHKLYKLSLASVVCLGLSTAAFASINANVSYFSQSYGDGLKATGTRFNLGLGFSPWDLAKVKITLGPEFSYADGSLNRSVNYSNSYYDLTAGLFGEVDLQLDNFQPYLRLSTGYAGAKFYNQRYLGGVYSQVGIGAKLFGTFSAGVDYRYTHLSNKDRSYNGNAYSFYVGISF